MTCPHCGGPVLGSQRFCGTCGGAIPAAAGDVTVATLTPPPVDASGIPISGSSRPQAPTTPAAPDDPTIAATIAPSTPQEAATFDGRGPSAGTRTSLPATKLEPGMRFGRRYHLIRSLGEGGMGAVFQAWDEELAVVVAIKVIRPESLKDPAAARDLERRFKRELLLARNVTHKNVVRIHDLGEIDGVKYITMPYIHGGDLSRLIANEGKLSVPRAMNIARQIAAGLVAAHEAGIVHRDLEARKHSARRGRPRPDHGLRYCALSHRNGRGHDGGHDRRHPRIHGAGAGAGIRRRSSRRHLRLRPDSHGHAGGPASRRAHGKCNGGTLRPHVEGAGAGAVDRSFDSRSHRSAHRPLCRPGSRPPVSEDRGACRRPRIDGRDASYRRRFQADDAAGAGGAGCTHHRPTRGRSADGRSADRRPSRRRRFQRNAGEPSRWWRRCSLPARSHSFFATG